MTPKKRSPRGPAMVKPESFVQTCWFNGTCPKCLRATATDRKGHTWCTNPRCVDSTSEERPA